MASEDQYLLQLVLSLHFLLPVATAYGEWDPEKGAYGMVSQEVMRIVEAPLKGEDEFNFQSDRVQLRTCVTCHAQEPALRTFKPCARCRVAVYCSKECQATDWKAGHKKRCVPFVE